MKKLSYELLNNVETLSTFANHIPTGIANRVL